MRELEHSAYRTTSQVGKYGEVMGLKVYETLNGINDVSQSARFMPTRLHAPVSVPLPAAASPPIGK
jgi:hypothetical protein